MAGLFSTSTDTMRATGGKVATNAESIRSELQALLNRLSALEGQWIGDGRTSFKNAETRYATANAKLNNALAEISRLIRDNESRYSADDTQASSGLNTAAATLDAPGF